MRIPRDTIKAKHRDSIIKGLLHENIQGCVKYHEVRKQIAGEI